MIAALAKMASQSCNEIVGLKPPSFGGDDYRPFLDTVSVEKIEQRGMALRAEILSGAIDARSILADLRVVHRRMFSGTTQPSGWPDVSGMFRSDPGHPQKGRDFQWRCHYPWIKWEMRITPSHTIPELMSILVAEYQKAASELKFGDLNETANLCAELIVDFELVHPFARGNQTVERALVIAIAAFAGFDLAWEIARPSIILEGNIFANTPCDGIPLDVWTHAQYAAHTRLDHASMAQLIRLHSKPRN